MHCRMLADISWLSCVSKCFLASILPTRATVLRLTKASGRCVDGTIVAYRCSSSCQDARMGAHGQSIQCALQSLYMTKRQKHVGWYLIRRQSLELAYTIEAIRRRLLGRNI